MVKIYHNSRCSKSRSACEVLKDHQIEAEIREILEKLNMKAFEVVRKTEDLYKKNFASREYSESEWIKILAENPILIERPIIVSGDKAVIGRPPEKVLELFKY